jgi:uncharacterized membrane protein YidH (DUF202 family)
MPPAETRDDLASARTKLAGQRTSMALDRTLLAWWRTGLGCYGLGLAIARLTPPAADPAAVWLGAAFVVAGILMVSLGYVEIRRARMVALGSGPRVAAFLLEGLLVAAGLACLTMLAPPR